MNNKHFNSSGGAADLPVWFEPRVTDCHCTAFSGSALREAFRFHLETADHDLCLNYRGPFLDDITSRIIDISKNTIIENKGLSKVNRKVSFLLVECFQNIIKHSDQQHMQSTQGGAGMFAFRNKGQAYVINSINPVKKEEVPVLKKTVDMVNSMDSEALKNIYKRQLEYSDLNEKGGAGLGLIELARRSGQRLNYQFSDLDDWRSYFHQQVMFIEDNAPVNLNMDHIDSTAMCFEQMGRVEMLMQYKGDFSQKSILPILDIVENNLLNPESGQFHYKKVGHLLIEVLQNISKHGYSANGKKEGIFMLGRQLNQHYLIAGNVVSHEDVTALKALLNELRNKDDIQLHQLHKERMKESIFRDSSSNAGLGLIEIAKASKGKLACDFQKIDENSSFFSLFACV
jgi:hypothetical protein